MSVKFENVKELNINNMKLIPIKTNDDKQVFVKTKKCFSFGVKKDKKFKTISMSLILDENSVGTLKNIVSQCEDHLGRPLTKKVFYSNDSKVTIYPKLKPSTKFYETEGEVDVSKYEDKLCDVKAVLEIGGILLNGDNASLQLKIYEALVKEHVREHVRLVDMTFDIPEVLPVKSVEILVNIFSVLVNARNGKRKSKKFKITFYIKRKMQLDEQISKLKEKFR